MESASSNITKRKIRSEGNTPGKKPPKQTLCSKCAAKGQTRKALFQTSQNIAKDVTEPKESNWTEAELSALVEYIALYNDQDSEVWPTHKRESFWTECARAVSHCTGKNERTWSACRMIVRRVLKTKFPTISSAEDAYGINYFQPSIPTHEPKTPSANPTQAQQTAESPMLGFSPLRRDNLLTNIPGSVIDVVTSGFNSLTPRQRQQLVVHLFHKWLMSNTTSNLPPAYTPRDFLPLAVEAIKYLASKDKKNLPYLIAKCFGEKRQGKDISRMPIDRMPYGMIEHNLSFFAANDATNLKIPDDYKSWCQSMYTLFGNKWAAMHTGPMWSFIQERCSHTDIVSSALDEACLALNTPSKDVDKEVMQTNSQGTTMQNQLSTNISNQSVTSPDQDLDVNQSLNTSFQELDINQPENTSSHGLDDVNESLNTPVQELESNVESRSPSTPTNHSYTSTLWSTLSACERREQENSNLSAQNLEEMYDIRPAGQSLLIANRNARDPLKAKVNIAAPSVRTIRRSIEHAPYSKGTEIQVPALEHMLKIFPSGRWWIKADGTDIQSGLRESMKKEWSGDVDLGEGNIQRKHKEYLEYLGFIRGMGCLRRSSRLCVKLDLEKQRTKLIEEQNFLQNGLAASKNTYNTKKLMPNVSEDSLFALAWDVEGYSKLLEQNQALTVKITDLLARNDNIARELFDLKNTLQEYVKGIYIKKRVAASHLLLFMISDECRNFKPYAIPVRVVKYQTITDAKVRELKEELRNKMVELGMTTVGFVTDGEFNSLRTQGETRPVNVIQIIMDAKAEAKRTPANQIEKFLKPLMTAGKVHPLHAHQAIPIEDIYSLHTYMTNSNLTFKNALLCLRKVKYPADYNPHPWVQGKTETKADLLKSLFALYLYRYKIALYTQQGVNFNEHLYVPEEVNSEPQHDREDHNHVLKRIATCVRNGRIPDFNVRALVACMHDPRTGLTYTALTGKRKQNVQDAEKVLSTTVGNWLQNNNHCYEAQFVLAVANWHKASDGRGLSEDERSRHNLGMLDFILEDWMPWYQQNRDFATIDINRPIKGIKGLTRELIVALTTNIESQEFRRKYGKENGLPPEHPRAGSTDDVEGIFAFLHELLGRIFDEKAFHDAFPKVMLEYTKKCDPDLPFHHYTGGNERYNEGLLPSFNVPSSTGIERLDRVVISRRADPGVFVANRAVIPQRGQLTVRSAHFRPAEDLPPPPI